MAFDGAVIVLAEIASRLTDALKENEVQYEVVCSEVLFTGQGTVAGGVVVISSVNEVTRSVLAKFSPLWTATDPKMGNWECLNVKDEWLPTT